MSAISFHPSHYVAGGLIDDVDVTFRDVRVVKWDYNGEAPESLAVRVRFAVDQTGDEPEPAYISAGNPDDYEIGDEGRRLQGKTVTGLRRNTNAAIFFASVIEAGFPPDKLGEDLSVLDNLGAHILRRPAPKRAGLGGDRQSRFEQTVFAISKVNRLPWEKAKAGTKAGAKAAPAAVVAPAGAEEELTEVEQTEAAEILARIVGENPGLTKQQANVKIFQQCLKKRPAFRKLLQSAEFQTATLGAPFPG